MKKIFLIFLVIVLASFEGDRGHFLSDHYDVSTGGASTNQVLAFNGKAWGPSDIAITPGGSILLEDGAYTDGTQIASVSETTDGSGDVTVSHDLGVDKISVSIQGTGTTLRHYSVHDKTTSDFKVRVFDNDTIPTALASTAVTFDWTAIRHIYKGPLDYVTGSSVAYATYLLRREYAGPIMRIRRSSDDAEEDFYPDANYELSLSSPNASESTTLGTWIGANDGYVSLWFSQSTVTSNASQTTSSLQPQIVVSGVVNLENGQPAIDFDGTDDYMTFSAVTGVNYSVFSVEAASGTGGILAGSNMDNTYYLYKNGSTSERVRVDGNTVTYTVPSSTGQQVTSFFKNATDSDLYIDGSLISNSTSYGASSMSLSFLGTWEAGGFYHNGTIQALMIYTSDEESNRVSIESALNEYFNIY